MRIATALIIILLTGSFSFAQKYEVSGKIIDSRTNKGLEFATLRVDGSQLGTTSDADGNYLLQLGRGSHELIVSYIGYLTDTAKVFIEGERVERNIYLTPVELMTEEIEILGEDPAYDIMRKVISFKKKFREKLNEYEYDAYSKFVIRSDRNNVDAGKDSTDDLGIFGILESETVGYFKKPDLEKQVVKSKRETANITRGVALPFLVNFYNDEIDVGEFKIKTPVADDAFDSYDYRLTGVTAMDSLRVYKIEVINKSELSPLLRGTIYVADSIFSVLRVRLSSNSAANPRLVDSLTFQQKFSPFKDNKSEFVFWMPTDVQIFAGGSFAGIVRFDAEVLSVISEYRINKKAPAGVFDDFVIQVLPDAGNKSKQYWEENRKLRETQVEKKAFSEIDKKTREDSKSLNIGLGSVNYGKKVETNPLSYYRYNRVEGSALKFNLDFRGKLRSTGVNLFYGYGTSDKKSKFGISARHRLINGWKLQLTGEAYKTILPIGYGEIESSDIFINTFTGLFDKTDNYDYYYGAGFKLNANYWLMPQLNLGLGYMNEDQTTAYTSTNYSFRKKDVEFSKNPAVNHGVLRTVSLNMRVNLNEYGGIDWGDGDVTIFRDNIIPQLDAGFIYSGKDFLSSAFEYRKYYARLRGRAYFNKIFNLRYEAGGIYINGLTPYQSLGFVNGEQGHVTMGRDFGSQHINEFPGDKVVYLTLRNNFGNSFWRNVPFLKSINLAGYVNFLNNEISEANQEYSIYKGFRISDGVYVESGFSLSNILEIFQLSFTWRLNNHFDGARDFYLTLSSINF